MEKEKIIELVSMQCRTMGLPDSQFFKFKDFILAIPGDEIPVAIGNVPVLILDNSPLPKTPKLIERFKKGGKDLQMFLDTENIFDITHLTSELYYLLFDIDFANIKEATNETDPAYTRRGLTFKECLELTLKDNLFQRYGYRGIHASKSRYRSSGAEYRLHIYQLGIAGKSFLKIAKETESFVDYHWVYPTATIYNNIE